MRVGYLMDKMVRDGPSMAVTTEWEACTGVEMWKVQGCAEDDWRVEQVAEARAGLTFPGELDHQVSEPKSHERKGTSCHHCACLHKENVTEER